jgi:hypothetical protein
VQPADIAYLRKHYNSLSDEALLDVDRAELTETAQQCYDEELKDRRMSAPAASEESPEEDGDDLPVTYDAKPDWAKDAACVCTFWTAPGGSPSAGALDAQVMLRAAGIPCNVATHKHEGKLEPQPAPRDELWVMVPGHLSMLARSVLDKELFNAEVEEAWRTYFETLSDQELRDADTKKLFAGFLDRIERVTRAYNEEKAKRRI